MKTFDDIKIFFITMDLKTKIILVTLLCALIIFLAYILLDKYSLVGEKEKSNQHNSNPPDDNINTDADTDADEPGTSTGEKNTTTMYFYYHINNGEKVISSTYDLSKLNKDDVLGSYKCSESYACHSGYAYELSKGDIFVAITEAPYSSETTWNEFVYSLSQNKRVTKNYKDIFCFLGTDNNDTGVFYMRESYTTTKNICAAEVSTNNYELITLGGYVISKDFTNIGLIGQKGYYYSYDAANNIVSAKKNGKWGIINISTGKAVVDYKYEAAEILENGRIIFKNGGKYYLSDLKETKVSKNSYDTIVEDYGNYMAVIDDSYLNIVAYNGNSLMDTKIKLYDPFERYTYESIGGVQMTDVTDGIITITITSTDAKTNGCTYYEYEYNVLTRKTKYIGEVPGQ